jgi:5S rRNA maturation endonuclease (ribonuclease M5)
MKYKKHPIELYDNDWESLNEGETIRVSCSHPRCREKLANAFTITRVYNGCVYNCYRCGTSGAVYKGSTPNQAQNVLDRIKKKQQGIKSNRSVDDYIICLPNDFLPLVLHDKSVPSEAYSWFYLYELGDTDLYFFNVGYSKKLERTIVPIYSNNHRLIAWQGRDIYYERNVKLFERKIINKKPLKYYTEYNKYQNNGKKLYYCINNITSNNIILVEDIVSAIKVNNKFRYNSVALLNSTLTQNTITDLNLYKYNKIYIWLDPDKYSESLRVGYKWRTLGLNVKVSKSYVDPKKVPYKEMKL